MLKNLKTWRRKMQIIKTKYLPATNTRGSRIKATNSGGVSATIPYPYELSGIKCHAKAVHEVNKKLNWSGQMVGAEIKDSQYVFIFVNDEKSELTTLKADIVLMPEEK